MNRILVTLILTCFLLPNFALAQTRQPLQQTLIKAGRLIDVRTGRVLENRHLGAIEVGKYADIIAVAGDPLRDVAELERVRFVMKGGEVVRNEIAR